MNKEQILKETQAFIKEKFSGEGTGHDYFHVERVVKMASKLAKGLNADLFLIELSAWLHDLGDYKLHDGIDQSEKLITAYLHSKLAPPSIISAVLEIVSQVSYSKGNVADSLEAKIVQDADRLDALGAIGIARVFAYGGKKNREIWNPEKPNLTSIQHFYDKLFKLKDQLNTPQAKIIAQERHEFLEAYLNRFFTEWEGK